MCFQTQGKSWHNKEMVGLSCLHPARSQYSRPQRRQCSTAGLKCNARLSLPAPTKFPAGQMAVWGGCMPGAGGRTQLGQNRAVSALQSQHTHTYIAHTHICCHTHTCPAKIPCNGHESSFANVPQVDIYGAVSCSSCFFFSALKPRDFACQHLICVP